VLFKKERGIKINIGLKRWGRRRPSGAPDQVEQGS